MADKYCNCADKAQTYISGRYYVLGKFLATRWWISAIAMGIALLIGIGALNLQIESRSEELWVPRGSSSYTSLNELSNEFGDGPRTALLYAVAQEEGQNILTETYMTETLSLINEVLAFRVEGQNYRDLCYPDYPGGDCRLTSIFQTWDFNHTVMEESFRNGTALPMLSAIHNQFPLYGVLGNLEVNNDTQQIVSATCILSLFSVAEEDPDTTLAWELAYMDVVSQSRPLIQVGYVTGRSFDDEVTRLITGDIMLFAISITVILIYLTFTLGPLDRIKGRWLLSLSSIVILMGATAVAFGLAGIFSVPFNSIISLLPFILLGVGVDDMIVILDSVNTFKHVEDIPERIGLGLQESGLSITLTSVTAVMAFAVGSAVDMPGISSFCIVAAFAFLANFLLQVICFPIWLALDEQRMKDGKNAFLVCLKPANDKAKIKADLDSQEEEQQGVQQVSAISVSPAPSSRNSRRGSFQMVFESKDNADLGMIEKCMKNYVAPYLLWNVWTRLFTILGFVAIAALSGYALDFLEVGLPDLDVVPDDSYIADMYAIIETNWPEPRAGVQIYLTDVDYVSPVERSKVFDLIAHQDEQAWNLRETSSWLLDLKAFMELQHFYNNSLPLLGDVNDADTFYDNLEAFLEIAPGYGPELQRASDGTIRAAKHSIQVKMPTDSVTRDPLRQQMESGIQERNLNGFSFTQYWLFTDIDISIPELTLQNMALALSAVLVVLIFMIKWDIVLSIGLCVVLIDVDLIGMMVLWDVKLNAISFLCLVMGIGISVDYCVHVGHAFAHSNGLTRVEKARVAITGMGASVTKGGITTFLGVMILSFASSNAFRTFFKMLFGTVVLGMLHGLIFLPAWLSFVGLVGTDEHVSQVHPSADKAVGNYSTKDDEDDGVPVEVAILDDSKVIDADNEDLATRFSQQFVTVHPDDEEHDAQEPEDEKPEAVAMTTMSAAAVTTSVAEQEETN